MNLALISDTHGQLPDPAMFRGADAILHAGDVGPDYQVDTWIVQTFLPWLHIVQERMNIPFYGTFGNHDFPSKWSMGGEHLHVNTQLVVGDQRVWFSPWSPTFGGWAWMRSEPDLTELYANIPLDTTMIVSHTPPYQLVDKTGRGEHVGSKALRVRMQELPQLTHVVCGHIHEARGDSGIGSIRVLNVACVDEQYEMRRDPIVWLNLS